ncbi:MAG: AgmX/PglI C-terminal domain-containing protein [Bdellovibrionales bacterium]
MIAISNESGGLLKAMPWEEGKVVGFNRLYGFVSEDTMKERQQNRKRHGFKVHEENFDFKFRLAGKTEEALQIEGTENCQVELRGNSWVLASPAYTFEVSRLANTVKLPIAQESDEKEPMVWIALALALLIPLGFLLLPKAQMSDEPVIVEQVTVQIKQPEVQKQVEITTALDKIPEVKKQAQVTKRAINQNLGFLGLLGKKDLKKAVGGVPTDLKDVSPGAGKGKEGSGGELLVGLGQGLKRTTVGNSGVAGLGGVGTHGAGGGAGGYGNSAIGSGEGKALSSVPLSQELVLEGGLDRSVVQATIAKYLSQVRACYETGLKKNPGLGGQVTMAFEIGGGGDLNFAKVQKTSLDNPEVEQCISTRMMGWKFPKPRGGVSVKVSYPFVLRSAQG